MSEWIEYKGSGEKPGWLPDDCGLHWRNHLGREMTYDMARADELHWNTPGSLIVAFRIVDPRYQHLVPPEKYPALKNCTNWFGFDEAAVIAPGQSKAVTTTPKESPVWPLQKYNVYRNAEFLGTVEIEDRPGMTAFERACDYLRQRGEICPASATLHCGLSLRRVSPSTNRRRGFLL